MSVVAAATAVGTVVSVAGAAGAASDARRAGREAQEAARANAADLLQLANDNTAIQADVAAYNAGVILAIGSANAAAVERNAARNIELMVLEFSEELRRHKRGEKILAGQVRSQFSSSGFQVNKGTPLTFLHNELDEAETERNYIRDRGTMTVFNYGEQERERASIIRLTASLNASSVIFNQEANSQIYLNEALNEANSITRGGESARTRANNQSDRILTGAAVTGINSAASAISRISFGGSNSGGIGNSTGQSSFDPSGIA